MDPTILTSEVLGIPQIVISGTVFNPLFLASSIHAVLDTEPINHAYWNEDISVNGSRIYFTEFAFYNYIAGKKTERSMELLKLTIMRLCEYRGYLADHANSPAIAHQLRGLNVRAMEYGKKYNIWFESELLAEGLKRLSLV